jgi:hypothetical protein
MTDPEREPASPPCQAPPGYWDADEDETPPPADDQPAAPPAPKTGDE